MTLRISGKSINVGDALRGRVSERTNEVLRKYFDGNYSGHITLSKDGFGFRTDCALHLDSGITLEADSNATDAYASADQALLMIEKRLRRYKSRLKDRSARKAYAASAALSEMETPALDAPSYIIEAPAEGDDEVTGYNPVIIAAAEAAFGQRSRYGTGPDRSGLHCVPARLQRPGEHHLPATGRQYRLDRSAGGQARGLAPIGIDAPRHPPYGPRPQGLRPE
jgi:ribosomal subunit interface protein